MSSNVKNILICCTGSVASIKVPHLADKLIEGGFSVIVVPTDKAVHFLKAQAVEDSKNNDTLENIASLTDLEYIVKQYPDITFVTDKDEWNVWHKRGDPVKHIELRKWADLAIVAPLDANTLAKLSNGLCDNLLTCIIRAWDFTKLLFFCPAMNTQMYLHPITSQQINILNNFGFKEIPAISKTLICGESGIGAMAEIDTIVNCVKQCVGVANTEKNV